MSNNATGWQTVDPAIAYPISQREADAESHILVMAGLGLQEMEKTISAHVAATYGVPHLVEKLKALKATFRNELSTPGEGK